jgi:hypothetical protein
MLAERFILLLSLIIIIATGCNKDTTDHNCEALKNSIAANNLQEVQTAITEEINQLPSKQYTEENIRNLTTSLSKCLTANMLCFSCIKTNPEQSEIMLSFNQSGATIRKIIDITYSPDGNMRFGGMHE